MGVHRSTSLMGSSLLLQQCPACLVRLTCIVFVMGGKCPYSWSLVGCCRQDSWKNWALPKGMTTTSHCSALFTFHHPWPTKSLDILALYFISCLGFNLLPSHKCVLCRAYRAIHRDLLMLLRMFIHDRIAIPHQASTLWFIQDGFSDVFVLFCFVL